MQRIFKYFLIFSVILLILVVLGITLIPSWMNLSQYKTDIAQTIEEHTQHDVVINGDIRPSFLPWLGFRAKNISVNKFINIDEIDVKLKFWPLFFGKIEPREISVWDATINFHESMTDEDNWISKPLDAKTLAFQAADTSDDRSMKVAHLPILRLHNINFIYSNEKSHEQFQIGKLFMRCAPGEGDSVLYLKGHFELENQDPLIATKFHFNGTLSLDISSYTYELKNLSIQTEVDKLSDWLTSPINIESQLDLSFKPSENSIDLKNIVATLNNIAWTGNFSSHGFGSDWNYSGDITFPAFSLKSFLTHFPQLHGLAIFDKTSGNFGFQGDKNNAQVKINNLTLDQTNTSGDGVINLKNGAINFTIHSPKTLKLIGTITHPEISEHKIIHHITRKSKKKK